MGSVRLLPGDCLDVMPVLDANSIDAIVTDPPYGLVFMGKDWDKGVPGVAFWTEALRVAKPGAHMLAFGGTRTWHRLACAIEDAGWEIRDTVMWVYGQGFPKSLNVSKRITSCSCSEGASVVPYTYGKPTPEHNLRSLRSGDVPSSLDAGTERREVLQPGVPESSAPIAGRSELPTVEVRGEQSGMEGRGDVLQDSRQLCRSEVHPVPGGPADDGAKRRVRDGAPGADGSDDGLSAATGGSGAPHRPQPTEQRAGQPRTVADEQGTQARGAWPVCGRCGLPVVPDGLHTALKPAFEPIILARKPLQGTVAANVLAWGTGSLNIDGCRIGFGDGPLGRWPANLIHDGSEEVVGLMPERDGGAFPRAQRTHNASSYSVTGGSLAPARAMGDSGSAARFFYCAKSSRADRNSGLDRTSTVKYDVSVGGASCRDVTMGLVESLRRAMSESTVTWHIGESGVSIMGRCPSDTLSTTLTAISRITTSAILNSLTPSLISAFTQDANLGAANGGSRAGSVASSSQYPPTTTLARLAESAPGARLVVSQMLSQISDAANWKPATNTHSTVKPTALMRYLCRLVTPPGGTVLDPFMGSGSTGKAAVMEGFDFMGIEVEPEYYALAEARIAHAQEQHTPQLEFAL